MNHTINQELFQFIKESPTAWHAAESVAERLRREGFTELYESEEWKISAPGKYFVRRGGSSIIALRLPKRDFSGFMIMAGHGDSPCFKIKDMSTVPTVDIYARLNVERYGGMLLASWMDRPLSAAGRLVLRKDGKIITKLVNVDRDLLLIPNLAIHMNRGANDGKTYNINIDMQPLFGGVGTAENLKSIVAQAAEVKEEDILDADLFLYPRTLGTQWGAAGEFISAPRLDDLQCVFGCLQGFIKAEDGESASALCVFDNEEVGSMTKQGAGSGFLKDVLLRVSAALGLAPEERRRNMASTLLVSMDNAHAVHPNHPEFADRMDRPTMNKGIVLKYNAIQRYATDAVSAALFMEICRRAGVPTQRYTNRADLTGGTTLGAIIASHMAVDTVDVGLAQLAMHSAYETAGALDTEYMVKASREFYSSSFRRGPDGMSI